MYDGMRGSRKTLMRWLGTNENFGKGWVATKLWYSREAGKSVLDTVGDYPAQNGMVGYPDGVSFGLMRQSRIARIMCANCQEEIGTLTPSVSYKMSDLSEGTKVSVKQFHFPKCCHSLQRDHVTESIQQSGFPDTEKIKIISYWDTICDNNGNKFTHLFCMDWFSNVASCHRLHSLQ